VNQTIYTLLSHLSLLAVAGGLVQESHYPLAYPGETYADVA
jgi:hypothetical protein